MNDITPHTDERIALYYPYLVPNDELWLKQALLYWDKIESIIPDNVKSMPGLLTNDLEYLESVGVFSTVDPGYFAFLINPDYIIEDVAQIIKNPKFLILKKQFLKLYGIREQDYNSYLTPVYEDKFTPYIIEELQKLGINIFYKDKQGEYMMGMLEAGICMSVLSKHLAGASSSYIERPTKPNVVPVTDSPIVKDLLYCSSNQQEQSGTVGINLVLKNLCPAPSADVPLADILKFKRKRKDELLHLRCVMDKYYRNLSHIQYTDELITASEDISSEIEESINNLTKTMQDCRMAIIHTSAELLLSMASINIVSQLPPSTKLASILIGGSRVLLTAHKCYLNITKLNTPKEFPFTYVLNARDEFGA